MNGARVFEDAYSGVFREQEDFFSCLHEIMGKSSWIRQKVRNLRLVPIIAGSTFEKELRSQYTEDGMDDGIITDTIANTALMLKYRGEMLPVRDWRHQEHSGPCRYPGKRPSQGGEKRLCQDLK